LSTKIEAAAAPASDERPSSTPAAFKANQGMRDFRDAKAMAHTLRAAPATKGHKVSNSESLVDTSHGVPATVGAQETSGPVAFRKHAPSRTDLGVSTSAQPIVW
jgi:hypothetical protein